MKVAVLPGDGIGPEVTAQSIRVLEAVGKKFGLSFSFEEGLIGGAAIDAHGVPLPDATIELSRGCEAILLGAVGGPKWDDMPSGKRPEAGLLAIRKVFGLYANLRPSQVYPELASMSCLRPELVSQGIDLVVVRELTGDVYFGQPAGQEVRDGLRYGFNNMIYNEEEVRRIAVVAFELARKRGKKLCSIDKANVLEVSRLWRAVVKEVHQNYQDVTLDHLYVDNAAMQMILNPAQFDVIVTGNIFGDIISDESAAVAGSLGLLPSASLGADKGDGRNFGLYEPVHGSAPDIAGQDKANPMASILSAAMLLRSSLGADEAAVCVEKAVRATLKDGIRTGDLVRAGGAVKVVGCKAMGDEIISRL